MTLVRAVSSRRLWRGFPIIFMRLKPAITGSVGYFTYLLLNNWDRTIADLGVPGGDAGMTCSLESPLILEIERKPPKAFLWGWIRIWRFEIRFMPVCPERPFVGSVPVLNRTGKGHIKGRSRAWIVSWLPNIWIFRQIFGYLRILKTYNPATINTWALWRQEGFELSRHIIIFSCKTKG